jgi:hypothetical protein
VGFVGLELRVVQVIIPVTHLLSVGNVLAAFKLGQVGALLGIGRFCDEF